MFIIVTSGYYRLVMPDSHSPILLAMFSIDVEHSSYTDHPFPTRAT